MAWILAQLRIGVSPQGAIQSFSPWLRGLRVAGGPGATRCTDERQWVVFKEVRDSVLHVLQMPLSVQHLLCHGQRITAALREKRPMRPRQAVKLHRLIVRLGSVASHRATA